MRTRMVIAVVATIMLVAPATVGAQDRMDDRVGKDAAALPERLWAPGSEPVSAAGPSLSEDDGGGVSPLLALPLLLVAVGAGFAVSLLRGVGVPKPAAPAAPRRERAPAPAAVESPRERAPAPAPVESPRERAPAPAAVESPREREPAPAPIEPAPFDVIPDAQIGRETCVIGLSHAWGRGRFEVRVKEGRAAHRVVASSPVFEVPAGMVVQESGSAGRAHRRLLLHLAAAGWELEPRGDGPWYERRLSRPARDEGEIDRALVTTRPDGGEAEFVALALDGFGNGRVMARSPRFARRTDRAVEATETAVEAHGALLEYLEAHGWHVSGQLEGWYGATLRRPRRHR